MVDNKRGLEPKGDWRCVLRIFKIVYSILNSSLHVRVEKMFTPLPPITHTYDETLLIIIFYWAMRREKKKRGKERTREK